MPFLVQVPPDMKWSVLWSGWSDGYLNMAVDDWLLATANERPPTLRIYGWLKPTVSLGRNERWKRVIQPSRLRKAGVRLVRRPTGGRAVFHHRELTYSVTAPHRHQAELGQRLTDTLAYVSEGLALALECLGIDVTIAHRTKSVARQEGVCFESATRFELLADGQKVVGNAQLRTAAGFLQHGSMPVYPSVLPFGKLSPRGNEHYTNGHALPTPLHRCADLCLDSLGLQVARAFGHRSRGGLEWMAPNRLDHGQIQAIAQLRYLRPEWTFWR